MTPQAPKKMGILGILDEKNRIFLEVQGEYLVTGIFSGPPVWYVASEKWETEQILESYRPDDLT